MGGLGCGSSEPPSIISKPKIQTLSSLPSGRVLWHEWASRDSARVLRRPIFLFIYSRRSNWCREMAVRCFQDRELARNLSQGTFAIRIDADRRPDLVDRFGLGGLPTNVFLTPDEQWITGGTYLDPSDLWDLFRRVRIYIDVPERMEDLEREREYLKTHLIQESRGKSNLPISPSLELLERAADSIRASMKIGVLPNAETLHFAINFGDQIGSGNLPAMCMGLLDRMSSDHPCDRDGLYYSATRTPDDVVYDYEKRLDYNVSLLEVLSTAVGKNPKYRKLAEDLGSAIQHRLSDGTLFCAGFAGFREPIVSGEPGDFPRDPNVYTSGNALAVSAFAALSSATEDSELLAFASDLFGNLEERLQSPNGLYQTSDHDAGETLFLLADQALVARAGLDLYAGSGDIQFLQAARKLADKVLKEFSSDSGALRDRIPEGGPDYSPAVDRWAPSGNGVAAQVLVRLYNLTGELKYQNVANSILTALIGPSIHRVSTLGALNRALAESLLKQPGEQRGNL